MTYDATTAIRELGLDEARVLLSVSRETVRKNASAHPIWKKYFWRVGKEYRTSVHLLLCLQEELAGLTKEVV